MDCVAESEKVVVVKFWPVLVGIIGIIVGAYWTRGAVDRHAERVVAERRRVVLLERENRELRSQLEELQRSVAEVQKRGDAQAAR